MVKRTHSVGDHNIGDERHLSELRCRLEASGRTLDWLCTSLLLLAAVACGGKETSLTSPSAPSTGTRFSLSGTVITSRTSVPIANASVSIVNGPDAGKSVTTDASGNFMFTELAQSSVIVEASAAKYFAARAPLALNQAQTIFLVPFGSDIVLEGRVTDARTSAPIAGATVYINGRYSAITDLAGNYTLPGNLDIGDSSIAWVAADGYEVFVRYIRGSRSQSFRLQRIERITAGESWPVTVRPDDSLCLNTSRTLRLRCRAPAFSVERSELYPQPMV